VALLARDDDAKRSLLSVERFSIATVSQQDHAICTHRIQLGEREDRTVASAASTTK
jgi:hypothetical protein